MYFIFVSQGSASGVCDVPLSLHRKATQAECVSSQDIGLSNTYTLTSKTSTRCDYYTTMDVCEAYQNGTCPDNIDPDPDVAGIGVQAPVVDLCNGC